MFILLSIGLQPLDTAFRRMEYLRSRIGTRFATRFVTWAFPNPGNPRSYKPRFKWPLKSVFSFFSFPMYDFFIVLFQFVNEFVKLTRLIELYTTIISTKPSL